jgi:hypothetical protein
MTVLRRLGTTVILGGAAVIAPATAAAQAWVPAKGEGAIAIAAQSMNVKNHLAGTVPMPAGQIDTYVLLGDLSYGLTDKVAVDLAVPLVTSKYRGPFPHPDTDIDDGTYRSTVTDFRMSVRYNITRKGMVFTPYIGTVVPSHGYQYYGHAAAGQRLREVQVGAFAAKLIASGRLAGLFVSGRAGYGFVEQVADMSHNRTSGDFEVGYFLTSSLRAFGIVSGQYTHGGIDFPASGGLGALRPEHKYVHDIIQQVHYVHAGGGVSYSISDSIDMFASFARLVTGRNGHALNRGITVGASWGFSRSKSNGNTTGTGGGAPSAEYARLTGKKEGSLGRCICQKSAS